MRDFALCKNRYLLHVEEKQAREASHISTSTPNSHFDFFFIGEKRHSKLITRAIFHRTHTKHSHTVDFRFSRSPCGEGKNWTKRVHF